MGLDITAINQFPSVTSGGPWNPGNAVQPWQDTAIAAQLAADPTLSENLAIYTTWKISNISTGAVSLYQFALPYRIAAVSNVPPAGYTSTSNAPIINSPNNNPIDPSQLKSGKYAGYTIGNVLPFNPIPPLIPPAGTLTPAPAGTDPVEADILADVRDIDKREGGTPI